MHEFVNMICKSLGNYFQYFKQKIHQLIHNTYLNWPFLAFLTSENDVNCTVTLRHLSRFWLVMVRVNVRKELFPSLKGIFPQEKYFYLLKRHQKCNTEPC